METMKDMTDDSESVDDVEMISLHDSESNFGSMAGENSDEFEKNNEIAMWKIKPNKSYVIVEYEGEFFPGIVKKKKNKKCEVSTMTFDKNNWKWPEKEDVIWYDSSQVKEIIEAPEIVPSTFTSRYQSYSVPEVQKYRKLLQVLKNVEYLRVKMQNINCIIYRTLKKVLLFLFIQNVPTQVLGIFFGEK